VFEGVDPVTLEDTAKFRRDVEKRDKPFTIEELGEPGRSAAEGKKAEPTTTR
jgi:hypothetical protein